MRQNSSSSQFVRASDLAAILGVSKSTIWRWRAEGKLPDPFRLSSRVTVWELKEVLAFVEQKRDLFL